MEEREDNDGDAAEDNPSTRHMMPQASSGSLNSQNTCSSHANANAMATSGSINSQNTSSSHANADPMATSGSFNSQRTCIMPDARPASSGHDRLDSNNNNNNNSNNRNNNHNNHNNHTNTNNTNTSSSSTQRPVRPCPAPLSAAEMEKARLPSMNIALSTSIGSFGHGDVSVEVPEFVPLTALYVGRYPSTNHSQLLLWSGAALHANAAATATGAGAAAAAAATTAATAATVGETTATATGATAAVATPSQGASASSGVTQDSTGGGHDDGKDSNNDNDNGNNNSNKSNNNDSSTYDIHRQSSASSSSTFPTSQVRNHATAATTAATAAATTAAATTAAATEATAAAATATAAAAASTSNPPGAPGATKRLVIAVILDESKPQPAKTLQRATLRNSPFFAPSSADGEGRPLRGVVTFEIALGDIVGLDYVNPLLVDASRLAVEAKKITRHWFPTLQKCSEYYSWSAGSCNTPFASAAPSTSGGKAMFSAHSFSKLFQQSNTGSGEGAGGPESNKSSGSSGCSSVGGPGAAEEATVAAESAAFVEAAPAAAAGEAAPEAEAEPEGFAHFEAIPARPPSPRRRILGHSATMPPTCGGGGGTGGTEEAEKELRSRARSGSDGVAYLMREEAEAAAAGNWTAPPNALSASTWDSEASLVPKRFCSSPELTGETSPPTTSPVARLVADLYRPRSRTAAGFPTVSRVVPHTERCKAPTSPSKKKRVAAYWQEGWEEQRYRKINSAVMYVDKMVSWFDKEPSRTASSKQDTGEPIGDFEEVISAQTINFRFDDPFMPYVLREVIHDPDLPELLRLYEAGLPAWAVYMPMYTGLYRRWMRLLVSCITVLISCITMLLGFYDLYNRIPAVRMLMKQVLGPLSSKLEDFVVVRFSVVFAWLLPYNAIFQRVGRTLKVFWGLVRWSLSLAMSFLYTVATFGHSVLGPTLSSLWIAVVTLFQPFSFLVNLTKGGLSSLLEMISTVIWAFARLFSVLGGARSEAASVGKTTASLLKGEMNSVRQACMSIYNGIVFVSVKIAKHQASLRLSFHRAQTRWFERMRRNPTKVLAGLTLVALCSAPATPYVQEPLRKVRNKLIAAPLSLQGYLSDACYGAPGGTRAEDIPAYELSWIAQIPKVCEFIRPILTSEPAIVEVSLLCKSRLAQPCWTRSATRDHPCQCQYHDVAGLNITSDRLGIWDVHVARGGPEGSLLSLPCAGNGCLLEGSIVRELMQGSPFAELSILGSWRTRHASFVDATFVLEAPRKAAEPPTDLSMCLQPTLSMRDEGDPAALWGKRLAQCALDKQGLRTPPNSTECTDGHGEVIVASWEPSYMGSCNFVRWEASLLIKSHFPTSSPTLSVREGEEEEEKGGEEGGEERGGDEDDATRKSSSSTASKSSQTLSNTSPNKLPSWSSPSAAPATTAAGSAPETVAAAAAAGGLGGGDTQEEDEETEQQQQQQQQQQRQQQRPHHKPHPQQPKRRQQHSQLHEKSPSELDRASAEGSSDSKQSNSSNSSSNSNKHSSKHSSKHNKSNQSDESKRQLSRAWHAREQERSVPLCSSSHPEVVACQGPAPPLPQGAEGHSVQLRVELLCADASDAPSEASRSTLYSTRLQVPESVPVRPPALLWLAWFPALFTWYGSILAWRWTIQVAKVILPDYIAAYL